MPNTDQPTTASGERTTELWRVLAMEPFGTGAYTPPVLMQTTHFVDSATDAQECCDRIEAAGGKILSVRHFAEQPETEKEGGE